MDDFAAQVLAQTPAWTNPSGTKYVSPVDGVGRFFSVELSRVDATTLSLVVRDQNEVTIANRRIHGRAGGVAVRMYTGQFHVVFDFTTYDAEPEQFFAGILDISPEPQSAHSRYVYAYSTRNSASAYASHWFMYLNMLDNASVAAYRRVNTYTTPISGYPTSAIDAMGYWTAQPALVYALPSSGGDYRYAGRMYQTVVVSRNIADAGAEVIFPIDAGVTGSFRVIGGIADANASTGYKMCWAVRTA